MSWKSFFIAGLAYVLPSSAFADPTLTMSGSRLTRSANPVRVWNIAVAPDLSLSTTGSPLALEFGFRTTGGNIVFASAAQNMPRRVERDDNPGNTVFGWETLTDVGGGSMQPVGIQIGTGANANTAVAFLGTADLPTGHSYDLLTIVTDASVTSLEWGGRFNPDSTMAPIGTFAMGRIAHLQGNNATNFDAYSGSRLQNMGPHFLGDLNGDGNLNFADLAPFGQALSNSAAYDITLSHLNRVGRGDFNGDGNFNFGDLAGFGQALTGAPGAGANAVVAAVPEPRTAIYGAVTWLFLLRLCRPNRYGFDPTAP